MAERRDAEIGLIVPLPGWDDSHVPRIRRAIEDAYVEEFGASPAMTTRQIEIGRGGDAGAVIAEIVAWTAFAYAVVVGPAELIKKGREAIDEYRSWARRVSSFVERLRAKGASPAALSPSVAMFVTIADFDKRVGPLTRLVWWDEMVIQQFDWIEDASRLESSTERLYFYVFETERARWYVATKADGFIVSEAETMIPSDYVEYEFWKRHDEPGGAES